ncbi:MAG: nicotinate-nucleotide adenylyltransferase [Clostridia bacterium]|nr:nicotinate-nucleotide adenylyltransferase [Clostridia bacterium]MCL6520796.1 nicotinate-nucleotide adenylyltransferase [Bacillota bacterium]
MGGTFDPIHYGHLVAAQSSYHHFGLERVVFVPAGHPPHKRGRRVTPGRQRFLMTVLATMSNPAFDVSDLEVERPGPSYTIDTLRAFRRQLGPDGELYFITGADATLEILDWKDPEELLRLACFVAATRPGYPRSGLEKVRAKLPPEAAERIVSIEIPALAISSTEIRRRVARGAPIKYLLPEPVEQYIMKNRLYLDDGGEGEARPEAGEGER